MIWDLSMLDIPGRLVSVDYNSKTDNISSAAPPVILSVRRDSRSQARKRYRQLHLESKTVSLIWVDFSFDTLRIDFQFMADRKFHPRDLVPIGNNWSPEAHILPKLAECESLRHLTIASPIPVHMTTLQDSLDHSSGINHAHATFLELLLLFDALLGPEDSTPTLNGLKGRLLNH
jgi:hypothetical protein